jgi:quercetin dioxygenase-like cupin family protein
MRSMKVFAGLLVPAFVVAGAVALPAMAQEKTKAPQRVQKVVLENDKVRVTETTFKPGEVSPSIERPYRITRVLQGGKTVRTYADGKVVERQFKTGEVFAAGPDKAYSTKNVSNSDIVLYTVIVKKASGMSPVALQSKKAQAAASDPKKPSVNVLLENDAVRVYEASIPAGTDGANVARPYRVGRALTNATIERSWPDGKKQKAEWKAGQVQELGPDSQYIPKNVGKSDFRIFVVEPKG